MNPIPSANPSANESIQERPVPIPICLPSFKASPDIPAEQGGLRPIAGRLLQMKGGEIFYELWPVAKN